MKKNLALRVGLLLAVLCILPLSGQQPKPLRLLIYDPGHFHATLLQKDMVPELDPRVSVYAPLGPELVEYLSRISLFNNRLENPTRWELDVHTGPAPFESMLHDRSGDVVVFSGHNKGKIDRILRSLSAGLHVLADKPWITSAADMPKLERALDLAARNKLAAYDIMTERYEITSQVMRELVGSREVFGQLIPGDTSVPAISVRSVHHIKKTVAGVALKRPVWFFDIDDYGDGLQDVGTHPVDLIQWTAFPDQAFDYRKDVHVESLRHESVPISLGQFQEVTGVAAFPPALQSAVRGANTLEYRCNGIGEYTLRGSRVRIEVLWKWEAPPGGAGDIYEAAFQGTNARIELRQGLAEKFIPEVYVVPGASSNTAAAALDREVAKWQTRWPGIAVSRGGEGIRIVIPQRYRVGHEDHFGQVAAQFLKYVRAPQSMPAWERSYMLAKYAVTTAK